MTYMTIALFAILGAVIGSFLNVVLYRMHTGRSLGGRSHCASCGVTLSWHELVPVLSYLILHGRCAHCSARISPRYMSVELLTALCFGLIAALVRDPVTQAFYAVFSALLVVIIVYDLRHTIIPDEYVVGATVVMGGLGLYAYLETGDLHALLLRGAGALTGFLFFFGLWLVSKGRWVGLGDAKLAVPLGLLVSWPQVISALVLSFWIGAAVSVFLLALTRLLGRGQGSLRFLSRSLTMKSEIPFAPFLAIGFLATHFLSFDAFSFIASLLP